jgi:hypothetical protein
MTGPTHTQYWVGPGCPGPPRIDATGPAPVLTHRIVTVTPMMFIMALNLIPSLNYFQAATNRENPKIGLVFKTLKTEHHLAVLVMFRVRLFRFGSGPGNSSNFRVDSGSGSGTRTRNPKYIFRVRVIDSYREVSLNISSRYSLEVKLKLLTVS